MTYQERVISATKQAVETLIRNVQAMPADRLEWQPEPTARTAMDIFQECAAAPDFYARILRDRTSAPMTPESMQAAREARRALKTVGEAETALRCGSEELYAAILAVPEADLDLEVTMPWGLQSSMAEIMALHNWNLTYHYGQIAYIQRLYGDVEMH